MIKLKSSKKKKKATLFKIERSQIRERWHILLWFLYRTALSVFWLLLIFWLLLPLEKSQNLHTRSSSPCKKLFKDWTAAAREAAGRVRMLWMDKSDNQFAISKTYLNPISEIRYFTIWEDWRWDSIDHRPAGSETRYQFLCRSSKNNGGGVRQRAGQSIARRGCWCSSLI